MTKLTKELLDKVRHIEGFPIGEDEDIIALSDPPHYTACPNPFIEDFIKEHGKPYDEETDDYHREPFAADVSEGKNDPIYNAHSYHTKVPHKAIMRYILHYTEPGDIVFDGFCGSGMTGVAAQMCGNPAPEFKLQIEKEMPYVDWGARKAILNDLSPAATFIASNYNFPMDARAFEAEAKRILNECEKECGWMYETFHVDKTGNIVNRPDGNPAIGKVNFVVWSDILVCKSCSMEIVFWDVAVDIKKRKIKKAFMCPHCNTELKKTDCDRANSTFYDNLIKKNQVVAIQKPVLINYTVGNKRYEKSPDSHDLDLIKQIEGSELPYPFPIKQLPNGHNTEQPKRSHGVTYIHNFYTKRNLWTLSVLWNLCSTSVYKSKMIWILTGIDQICSRLLNYRISGSGKPTPLKGTLYLSSLYPELNPLNMFYNKYYLRLRPIVNLLKGNIVIETSSLTNTSVKTNSIDYIFTDPPFGSNIMYSELNLLWESWLKVSTNNKSEAIVNRAQKKGMPEYQELMERCFAECYRVLKPGRWMTVEFHNSSNSVWNSIQEALVQAGFIVADVRTLDKQQGSFKQVTTTTAVKQDLIISAYKPREKFKRRFLETAGTPEAVWEFVRQHLEKLPAVVENNGKLDVIAERQVYLLFDRMVAYHVVNGITVPMDAGDFYKGMKARFIERDGMYFLPNQVNEYDSKRLSLGFNAQLSFFVTDEKSAIQWLYQELSTPQTYQEIQPKFIQELHQFKHEKLPELRDLLEENFLQDDEGRWYIPDHNKQSDLDKLREKTLLREFEESRAGKGTLKVFRTEAVRAGFKSCWQNRDYATIVKVANRIPEKVLQEDQTMLMFYNNALSRVEK